MEIVQETLDKAPIAKESIKMSDYTFAENKVYSVCPQGHPLIWSNEAS